MSTPKTRLTLAVALAALTVGCGGSKHATPGVPSLYTNANAQEVWLHPEQHLGAHINVRGTVRAVTRVTQGVVVALALPDTPELIGAHVFDRHFHAHPTEVLDVAGTVRGPLGSPDVPGVPLVHALLAGTAVIDAQAASIEPSGPVARQRGPVRPGRRTSTRPG